MPNGPPFCLVMSKGARRWGTVTTRRRSANRSVQYKEFTICTLYSWLAETPECWSLEFQLDATFADSFGHICRQIMCICGQFYQMIQII